MTPPRSEYLTDAQWRLACVRQAMQGKPLPLDVRGRTLAVLIYTLFCFATGFVCGALIT